MTFRLAFYTHHLSQIELKWILGFNAIGALFACAVSSFKVLKCNFKVQQCKQ